MTSVLLTSTNKQYITVPNIPNQKDEIIFQLHSYKQLHKKKNSSFHLVNYCSYRHEIYSLYMEYFIMLHYLDISVNNP